MSSRNMVSLPMCKLARFSSSSSRRSFLVGVAWLSGPGRPAMYKTGVPLAPDIIRFPESLCQARAIAKGCEDTNVKKMQGICIN